MNLDNLFEVNKYQLTSYEIWLIRNNSNEINCKDKRPNWFKWYFDYFYVLNKYFKYTPNYDYGFSEAEIETFKNDYELTANIIGERTFFKDKLNLFDIFNNQKHVQREMEELRTEIKVENFPAGLSETMLLDGFQKEKQVQLNLLANTFINNKDSSKFMTFGIEAGLGKTLTIENILAEQFLNGNLKKTLFVKPFMDREDSFPSYKNINDKAGQEIAIAIDSNNFDNYKDKLYNYPVVIITHKRYLNLCSDIEQRQLFIKDRVNLIIDEEVPILDVLEFRTEMINEIEVILQFISDGKTNAKRLFNDIIWDFEMLLVNNQNRNMRFINLTDNEINCKIDGLVDYIKKNIKFNYFGESSIKKCNIKNLQQLIRSIEYIKKFYNCNIIVKDGTAFIRNSKIDYFMLQNNILLDASSNFNSIYNISDKFSLIKQDRIVDHSKTNFNICYLNTTESAKKKYANYQREIVNHIIKNNERNDKVLLVGLQEELDQITDVFNSELSQLTIDYANFGNMRGKNDWKDYNKCYIIHTPNLNYINYLFLYQQYSLSELKETDLVLIKNEFGNLAFANSQIENLRKTYIASNIYQAIKRINRMNELDADIYIINCDKDIINLVKEQLKNVSPTEFTLGIEGQKRKEYNTLNRNEGSHANDLVNFLFTAPLGTYSKKNVREAIEYGNSNTFNKIINNAITNMKKVKSEERRAIDFKVGNDTYIMNSERCFIITFTKIIISDNPFKDY